MVPAYSCPYANPNKFGRTIYFVLASGVLLFCPVTHMAGLALDDNAFASPHLTSAERVFTVKNQAPSSVYSTSMEGRVTKETCFPSG